MPSILSIWLGMIVLCVPFVYFVVRMQKRKSVAAGIDLDRERANAGEYQEELLSRDWKFLREWMGGAPIDAYTSASVPLTFGDHAKNLAKDAVKSVAWAALGVKARSRRVETPCYVVLSGKDVYFFGTDVDGDLDLRSVIDGASLERATLTKRDEKAAMGVSPEDLPQKFELQFDVEGRPLAIHVHDRLVTAPNLGAMLGGGYFKAVAKNRVVGERFLAKLGERFPNLHPAWSEIQFLNGGSQGEPSIGAPDGAFSSASFAGIPTSAKPAPGSRS